MAKKALETKLLNDISLIAKRFVKIPIDKMWLDYDREADVLYVGFKRPQKATDTEMTRDGILPRYRGKNIVGITILDVSKRKPD